LSSSEDELEMLKQRRMAEMRRRAAAGEEEQIERARQQAEAKKDNLLRSILSPEARSRLQNLKMVRPDFCEQIELQLIQLAQAQRLLYR
jgi:programmed cell death protein 5